MDGGIVVLSNILSRLGPPALQPPGLTPLQEPVPLQVPRPELQGPEGPRAPSSQPATRRVYQDTRTFYLWWVSCGFISAPKCHFGCLNSSFIDHKCCFELVHLKSTPLLKLKFSQTHNYLTRMAFNFGYFKIAWLETSPPFS